MSLLRHAHSGLRTLFRREAAERDLDDELRDYLARAAEQRVRDGMSRAAAEREARLELGGIAATKDLVRDGGWESSVESLAQDVRYAFRGLRRNAGFSAVAVVTLALGIGASTTMFSVVNAVMLRPLPFRDADRLVVVWTDDARRGLHREATAFRTITDWRAQSRTFTSVGYYGVQRIAPVERGPSGRRSRSRQALVSGNVFATLGVPPAMGRSLTTADDEHRLPVTVISHSFWQRWFGGASDVIGRTIAFDDGSKAGVNTYTVVGVMPASFFFPDKETELWTPASTYWRFTRESTERFSASARRWTGIARLAPDASVEDARADLGRIGRQLATTYPSDVPDFPGFATTVTPMLDVVAGTGLQSALWMLLGATGLVLLIACANVANLLLARGATRQQELAVRRALGGGRGRLVRQLVAESVVLGLVGAVPGMVMAAWGTHVLGSAASVRLPRIDELSVDARVLAFAVMASIVAALVFGVVPALRLSAVNASEVLKQGEGGRGSSIHLRKSRGLVVLIECSLAIVLLAGAGLLLKSLNRLQGVNPGFDPHGVLTVRLEFPPEGFSREQGSDALRARSRAQWMNDLLDRIATMPDVTSAGFTDDLFIGGQGHAAIAIPGRTDSEIAGGELLDAAASAGFIETMRTPLRRGRALTREDATQKIRALWAPIANAGLSLADKERLATFEPVVVNEAFVRRFFPNEEPIGKRFCVDPTRKTYWYEIVGVIGDMHRQGLERPAIPEFFGPYFPSPNGRADLVVRTRGNPLALGQSIRQEVLRALPTVVVVSVSTAEAQLGDFSAQRRLQTALLATFALLALVLATIGVFGLVHYAVAERRREIGVRLALGATPGNVASLVVAQGMRAPVVGTLVGLGVALVLTRLMSHLLFGVRPTDASTYVVVAAVLIGSAALACYVAARACAKVDPVRALSSG